MVIAVVVLAIVVALAYFFSRSASEQLNGRGSASDEGPILAQFSGNGLDAQYPDTLSLNRVIRGSIQSADLSRALIRVATQVNWPEPNPVRDISFQTLPSTEYLCWGAEFVTGDGTRAQFNDSIFLLDTTRKLFVAGQRPLSIEEAQRKLDKNPNVIVALTQLYDNSSAENKIFQIGIIGCQ